MADVNKIFILHTTVDEDDADTDANFQLIVQTGGFDVIRDFPGLDHDERERGRTDEYMFDVSNENPPVTTESEIKIRMSDSENGWLPKTMWAIGETREGQFELLAAHSEWSKGWFDRGDPASLDEHVITP